MDFDPCSPLKEIHLLPELSSSPFFRIQGGGRCVTEEEDGQRKFFGPILDFSFYDKGL